MTEADFGALMERARTIHMDAWDRRAQRISWAVGQVMAMGSYTGTPDEWELRLIAAKEAEKLRGV